MPVSVVATLAAMVMAICLIGLYADPHPVFNELVTFLKVALPFVTVAELCRRRWPYQVNEAPHGFGFLPIVIALALIPFVAGTASFVYFSKLQVGVWALGLVTLTYACGIIGRNDFKLRPA